MNKKTQNLMAGIALLLIGLPLTVALILSAPHTARANPGILYAAPTARGNGNCSSSVSYTHL
ncbi:MAG: hypothetical protein N2508_01170, partial [Anaerolineae bacterium]|nr:hypothetical protein [Anaerolineae bacterium]